MGRGIKHFYAEGAKIENANKVDREVEFEELALKAVTTSSARGNHSSFLEFCHLTNLNILDYNT